MCIVHADRDGRHRDGREAATGHGGDLARTTSHYDFFALGLGDPVPVSALSGKGSGDLLDEIVARLPDEPDQEADRSEVASPSLCQ
jgi:predicted GTPase